MIALAVVAVASVLPIWQAVYFGSWEITGERATFWEMSRSFWIALAKERLDKLVFRYFGSNLVMLAVLVAVSIGVGRWLGRRAGRVPS